MTGGNHDIDRCYLPHTRCIMYYGAQNLVTATFEQRPIWPGKKIKIKTPDFGPNDAQKYTWIKRTELQCNNNGFFSGK